MARRPQIGRVPATSSRSGTTFTGVQVPPFTQDQTTLGTDAECAGHVWASATTPEALKLALVEGSPG